MQPSLELEQVPIKQCRLEWQEESRWVPRTVQKPVVNRIVQKVPVQTLTWKQEEVVRKVPMTEVKYVQEEKVEQIPVRVCKWVAVQENRVTTRKVPRWVPCSEFSVVRPQSTSDSDALMLVSTRNRTPKSQNASSHTAFFRPASKNTVSVSDELKQPGKPGPPVLSKDVDWFDQ